MHNQTSLYQETSPYLLVSKSFDVMKMEQGNRNWDPKSLSQEFLEKATASEKYLDEIKTKLHLKRSYEPILDQTFAELHVFSSLHGKPFLATRDDLLAGLRGLLEIDVPKVLGVIDFERFKRVRKKSSKTSSEDLKGMVSK